MHTHTKYRHWTVKSKPQYWYLVLKYTLVETWPKNSENQTKMFVFIHKTAKFCKFCKALSDALSLLTFGKCKISVLCGMSRSGVVPRTVYVNNGDPELLYYLN